ncbi:MAG TPA: tetratricopeptide repeat protein [Anaerolineales bacterium]
MPDTSVQHGRTFAENIDILFDEIVLAAKWGRPSLLLAVHKSRIGQEKAEQALEERLAADGFGVTRMVINDRRSEIAALIRNADASPRTVLFISNIDWGGGDDGRQAYRALNLHRELFVDEAIKAVFWLTTNEAANLPRFAPDFWAFRHRVVEFVSQRAAGKVQLPAGILAWDIQRSPDPFESPEDGIRAREDLLQKLPDTLEALSTRVEIRASLGFLHWTGGDLERAVTEFNTGMELAKGYELPEIKASLLNGMANIMYERGEFAAALDKYSEGLRFRSSSRVLLSNISAVQCMLGRVQESLQIGKKAVQAAPGDADTWMRQGYIINAGGRADEAIAHVAKAAELAPRSVEARLALAVLYDVVDRPDDARAQLTRARELSGSESSIYVDILQEAMLSDSDQACRRLKAAITDGRISKLQVRRDVNLGLAFEAGQLEEALA